MKAVDVMLLLAVVMGGIGLIFGNSNTVAGSLPIVLALGTIKLVQRWRRPRDGATKGQ